MVGETAYPPVTKDPDRATRATVLLVDDDRSSLGLVSAYLEAFPARLGLPQDGIEALRMAEELEPDVTVGGKALASQPSPTPSTP